MDKKVVILFAILMIGNSFPSIFAQSTLTIRSGDIHYIQRGTITEFSKINASGVKVIDNTEMNSLLTRVAVRQYDTDTQGVVYDYQNFSLIFSTKSSSFGATLGSSLISLIFSSSNGKPTFSSIASPVFDNLYDLNFPAYFVTPDWTGVQQSFKNNFKIGYPFFPDRKYTLDYLLSFPGNSILSATSNSSLTNVLNLPTNHWGFNISLSDVYPRTVYPYPVNSIYNFKLKLNYTGDGKLATATQSTNLFYNQGDANNYTLKTTRYVVLDPKSSSNSNSGFFPSGLSDLNSIESMALSGLVVLSQIIMISIIVYYYRKVRVLKRLKDSNSYPSVNSPE